MNILIAKFCGLGNSVLLSSTFRSLKNHPNLKLFFVGNNKYSGLSIHNHSKYIDEIIDISNLNLKSFKKLKNLIRSCDQIIIPEHSNPSILFLVVITFYFKKHIKISSNFFKRLHFFKKIIFNFLSFIKNIKIEKINFPNNIHEIEINRIFITDLLETEENIKEDIFDNYFDHPGNPNCIKKFNLEDKKYIVIQPFCANGLNNFGILSKSWSASNFSKLTDFLLDNYKDYLIVFVGDKGDGNNQLDYANNNRIFNLISQTTIEELISILKNSNFIICHDSSILHLSDSMKLKNLSLFGPTNFNKNKPNNSQSFFIKKNTMSEISFNEVTEILKKNI